MSTPSSPAPAPQIEDTHWRRRPGEIAGRVQSQDLRGGSFLSIAEGTTAVILRDGKLVEQQPGAVRYPASSRFERWFGGSAKEDVTIILVDGGEIPLQFAFDDLWTLDPLRLCATCQLILQVTDPVRFYRNVLKDQPTYTATELAQFILPELRDTIQAYLADHTMEQLIAGAANRRDDFSVDVRERMREVFSAYGLEFKRVQMLELRHPRFDQLRQQEEELYLRPAELDMEQRLFDVGLDRRAAELEGARKTAEMDAAFKRQALQQRKLLADVADEEELQQIAESEREVAYAELRAQLFERVRRATLQDKLNAATTDEEWASFVAEADRRKLLREDELAQLREGLRTAAENRSRERAHVVAMAQLYGEFEQKSAQLSEQFKYDRTRLENELTLARQETLGRLELEQKRVELDLEQARMKAAHDREQRQLDDLAVRQRLLDDTRVQLEVQLATAANELDRAKFRIQIERMEDDNDLLTAEKSLVMLRRNREEKLRIEREHWLIVQRATWEDEQRRFQQHMAELRQQQEHELARMDKLAQMSAEALIVLADSPEKTALLADLKRTETLKGFSEEQILALAAEKNPAVVDAIKARYQALREGDLGVAEADKWKTLAEAAAKGQAEADRRSQETLDRVERMNRDSAERQERLANQALDRMADLGKAFAQKPDAVPPIIVAPGAPGGGGSTQAGGTTPGAGVNEVQICPKCHNKMPVGKKFCADCGHQFYT